MPERYLGRTLGKYRIDAVVGAGGFAWVYKAYDPELEIPVALKILKPQYAGDETFEGRFRREASTAARLRHPNIVKIYAVGREDDAVYFAMDYLPQGLSDKLEVMTTLPESMVIRMGIDVASAIGFAHREGVIHRDIKTDNILFDEHGNAIVADFGIARAVSGYAEQTGTNMVVGTPQYFSPEQARGLQLDGRADIYSLGVTLFKAATGVLPFTGDDWYEIARQHVEDKPPRPRSLNPGLSRDLEDVILKCLEKDPEDRYQTGEALAQELATLLQDRGESATFRTLVVPAADTAPQPAISGVGRPSRRKRQQRNRLLAAGAIGLAVLAGSVAWLTRDEAGATPTGRGPRTGTGTFSRPGAPLPGSPSGPTPKALVVEAPTGSEVTLNGRHVASGDWRSDTLPAGQYTVAASVAAIPGCPTAQSEATVLVADTGITTARLRPRPCGTLLLDIQPTTATYVVSSFAGDRTVRGRAPMSDPLVLGAGTYRVRVESRLCAPWTDEAVRIEKDTRTARRIRLICGK